MTPSVDRIDHVHVFVADRARAERWYADVLGFARIPELAFWAAGGGPLTIANPAGTVHLALFEQPARPCRSTVAFSTSADQFMAWRRHLEAVLAQPPRLDDHQLCWSMYFADPDGNPFEISCYEHAALAPRLQSAAG